jgi:hypothetical protein
MPVAVTVAVTVTVTVTVTESVSMAVTVSAPDTATVAAAVSISVAASPLRVVHSRQSVAAVITGVNGEPSVATRPLTPALPPAVEWA